MSDLITTSNIVPSEVFVENGLDPTLKKIRKKIDDFVPDMTTAKGRKEIKSFAYAISQTKTWIDDRGKDLVSEIKATVKVVDAERRRARDTLDDWRDEVRQPVTDWEKEEEERETFLQACLDELSTLGNLPTGASVEEIDAQITRVTCVVIDDTWGDREGLAGSTKEKILEHLQERRADRLQFEEQQAELEAQRIENEKIKAENERLAREKREAEEEAAEAERVKQEAARAEEDRKEVERQRKDREEHLKHEAAERATAEAEQKAQDERDRLEREKDEADERARLATEQAEKAAENERNRIAAEQLAEQEAAQKREANKRHRGKINSAAKRAFIDAGLSEESATAAVTAIASGQIPAVKISY